MGNERVRPGEEEELLDEERDEAARRKPKPCPRGVHGHHLFIGGRCVRCGELEPLER